MKKNEREIRDTLTDLATRAGAHISFEFGGKHRKYVLTYNGVRRIKPFTVNNNVDGQLNCIRREFHKLIKELSVENDAQRCG